MDDLVARSVAERLVTFLEQGTHNIAAVNVRSQLPGVKTQIAADYGWIDNGTVIPSHVFVTQQASLTPGLNIYFRQPLPSFFGMQLRDAVRA